MCGTTSDVVKKKAAINKVNTVYLTAINLWSTFNRPRWRKNDFFLCKMEWSRLLSVIYHERRVMFDVLKVSAVKRWQNIFYSNEIFIMWLCICLKIMKSIPEIMKLFTKILHFKLNVREHASKCFNTSWHMLRSNGKNVKIKTHSKIRNDSQLFRSRKHEKTFPKLIGSISFALPNILCIL